MKNLTLSEALKTGSLEAFIRQQESQGIKIPEGDLEAALLRAIKQQPAPHGNAQEHRHSVRRSFLFPTLQLTSAINEID